MLYSNNALLPRVAGYDPGMEKSGVPVVCIKLRDERPALNDPLGRRRVGYRAGLSTAQLWDRGRGVWKFRVERLVKAELLLITYDDVIRLVGTIEGLTIHGDRFAVIGTPLPNHPLTGQPNPFANKADMPMTYGTLHTGTLS